ncbi:unnamed protein product [Paramecium sonneborni]|uniref:SEC7 domain-containing protein n=1 Tax=Paramecium sonneborni TaxID=65129 RepID=A0A8S1P928_9CILI|nr:unnamed protein product [Paramecium sonneborni]
MNQNYDSHVIYQEVLTSSLNKLLKLLPKQMISLKTLIEKSLEQIEQAKNDINRFSTNANKYFIIYKYCIDIKHNKITECCLYDLEKLITQNFLDGYSYDYLEFEKGKQKDRMLIDSIVESIISCTKLQDENLHYLIVKCIDGLFKQQRLVISGETLLLIIKTYFHLYKLGIGSIKNSIKIVIKCVYDNSQVKVDMENMLNKGLSWNKIYNEPKEIQIVEISDVDVVEYIAITLRHMVDDVILYNERIKRGQNNIPIASVPQAWEAEDIKYKNYIEVKVIDNGITSGKFGWCILCRQPAPYFCKDTRVPVCSVPCKKKHFEMIENIKIMQSGQQNRNDDSQIIFKYLLLKANKEKNIKKEICLDFIHYLVEQYPLHIQSINFDENFINMICLNIINKRTSNTIFKILVLLIYHARDLLQFQLEIIIDFILNKLPLDQISVFLDFVIQLIEYPKLILELFTNHDCVIERKNLIQPLFEKVAQIAQGKQTNQDNCLIANNIIQKHLQQFIKLVQEEQNNSIAGFNSEQIEEQNDDQLKKMIKNIEHFDQQLTYKQQILTGLQKFQQNWKEGLKYLFSQGILDEKNHVQIAQFLHDNPFNKDQLGQFFCSSKENHQLIFQIYSQSIVFKGNHIVDALRKYLNYFTLPGEAQQVDRCMLVFSQKFFQDNSDDVFKTCDETYVFSYLLIILQTDIYNKSVKTKMTFQQFCKSSKLSMERDLGEEYLRYCFDQILKEPLAIHQSIKQQQNCQINWINLERKSLQQKIYIFMPRIDYIKLFMEVFWPALFVNLNVTIERTENIQIISIAMQNATYTLQLMSMMGICDLCQQFICWLCQLASLENKQLKQKNYKAIQCIIDLAIKNGNALKNNWRPVLEIISSINYIQNEKQKGKILQEPLESISKNIQNIIDISSIDKVMQNTSYMDSRTILDFLQSLIDVSLNEITLSEPRIFSLQRLVEVTSFNMDRIRLIWMQIWNLLKAHFVTAGIHSNSNISLYACDQLKQMSVKFIQQYEHNNFKFQMEYLQPFELIYAQTSFSEVKEFILSCMRMLSHMCYYKLKSGWRVVFKIINQSLQESIQLVDISIDVLNKIFSEDFINLKDIFDEIDQTFQFLFNREEQHILLKGIEYVQNAVESLMKQDNNLYYAFWMQSLAYICNLFSNNQQQIQEQAILSFFKILKSNTQNIKGHQYVQIMKGMMKELFVSLNKAKKEICQMAHKSLLELVFDHNIKEAYNEISAILLNSTLQSNEYLAKISVMTFKSIIIKEGQKLDWNLTIQILDLMVQNTTPNILVEAAELDQSIIDDLLSLNLPKNQIKLNSDQLTLKCILQLMLIDIIQDIVDHHIKLLNEKTYQQLLNIAQNLFRMSFKFNRQIKLRQFLQQQGFMPNLQQLPGLIKQEKSSAIGILNLLHKQSQMNQELLQDLIQFILEILEDTKILGQIQVNKQFKVEVEKIIINNLSIIQVSIIPILNGLDIQKVQDKIKSLLSYSIQLPSCYSLLMSQCPHCQICPYKCMQKYEWKKLYEQMQQLQLKLISQL